MQNYFNENKSTQLLEQNEVWKVFSGQEEIQELLFKFKYRTIEALLQAVQLVDELKPR